MLTGDWLQASQAWSCSGRAALRFLGHGPVEAERQSVVSSSQLAGEHTGQDGGGTESI